MAACHRVLLLYSARKQLFLGCCFPKLYSTELANPKAKQGEKDIVVPFRIQRGPTDVLKALATTISKDYTAAHYKYHDDPYLIPVSNISKRAFALSKESGKRAARYFLENYPEFFKCNYSVPHVPAFDPPVTYNEEDDVDEKILQNCVKSHNLSESINVYEILKKKNVSLSQETKLMLLELLCFYNETSPAEYDEERWFAFTRQKFKNTWKASGTAAKLFNDCEKDSAAYCTMILGMAKYQDADKAFLMYEEMRSQNLAANTEVYNSLLVLVPRIKETGNMQWDFAMELVSNMNREGLFPNLYTMNALLAIPSKNRRWNIGRSLVTKILAEMKRLSIEPSLGSYYHVLNTFFQENYSFPSVFASILDKIESQDLEIRHPDDVMFFVTAMEVCNYILKNKDFGYRIHALLEKGKNSSLIGNSLNESIYYRHLFQLLCQNEDLEKFMEFYNKYVPNVYTPEPSVVTKIILAAEFNGAYQYLPQIGSDLIVFEQSDRDQVVSDFLRVAGSVKHEEEVQKSLVDISWKIRELIDNRQAKLLRRTFQWTGSMLGNLLRIFLNGEDLEKARHVLLKLRDEESLIIGYPEKEVLLQFCSLSLETKDFGAVKICVKYAVNSCYPDIKSDLQNLVDEMFESQKLSEDDRFQVNYILDRVGHDEDTSIQTDESCNDESEQQNSSN